MALRISNLGSLYEVQGKYAKAKALHQRALQITEQTFGPDHAQTALILNNLALAYKGLGEYKQAESLYQRALKITENSLGREHPDLIKRLNNLALLYLNQKEYAQAESLFQRALRITEQTLGTNHPMAALTFNNLGGLYQDQRRETQAEPLFQRALQINEKVLGSNHPDVAANLNNLAGSYYVLGRPKEALRLFERGLAITNGLFQYVFSQSNEIHQLKFAHDRLGPYHRALALIMHFLQDDPQALAIGMNLVLAFKGLVLDTQVRIQEAFLRNLPPDLVPVFHHWQEAKAAYGKLLLHRPSKLAPTTYKQQLKTLHKKMTTLESTVVSQSPAVANLVKSQRTTLHEVSQQLPENSVFVEIVKFTDWDVKSREWSNTSWYVAFAVFPNQQIQFVVLGDGEGVDKIVRESLANLRQGPWDTKENIQMVGASKLYIKLWQPLTKVIGNTRTVILSPDGMLNLVPFAALVTPGRQVLD